MHKSFRIAEIWEELRLQSGKIRVRLRSRYQEFNSSVAVLCVLGRTAADVRKECDCELWRKGEGRGSREKDRFEMEGGLLVNNFLPNSNGPSPRSRVQAISGLRKKYCIFGKMDNRSQKRLKTYTVTPSKKSEKRIMGVDIGQLVLRGFFNNSTCRRWTEANLFSSVRGVHI